jgi:ABC-type multidrug transport system fused ATPase/permease subunit
MEVGKRSQLFKGIELKDLYRVYRLLGFYSRSYWKWFLLAYSGLFASVMMNLLKPWPLKLILDHILLNKPMSRMMTFLNSWAGNDKLVLLALLSLGIVVVFFLEGLFSFTRKYYMVRAGESTVNDIRQEVFGHLQMLARGKYGSGDSVVRLTSDVQTLNLLLTQYVQNLVTFSFTFLSIVVTLFLLDWHLTLLALVVVPPLYLMSLYFSPKVGDLARKKREKESEVASLVQETLTSKEVVQAFVAEDQEQKRFAEETNESLRATLGSARVSKGFERTVQVTIAVGTALVVYFGARRVLAGQITPGDLIVFTAYLRDLYKPVGAISGWIMDFAGALISGERIAEILETEVSVIDAPDAIEAPPFRGEVVFEHVTFGYEPREPVLQNLSFSVKPGQTVALIGSSGTGKSTVVNLLLRFYDPWEGRILIDGQDIRRYKFKTLREQISVVLQETLLFRRTIRENIAYGKPSARLTEIVEAAKAAQAYDFIKRLPKGYDTFLRDRGANLSGGERQRIALARSILKDAPIFIFDEPVTGVDAETAAKLDATLNRLMKGKTSFIIAHHFSTIMKADLILMIEEGRIIEQGSHDQLLARSEQYRQLYNLQRLAPPSEAGKMSEGEYSSYP